MDTILLIRKNLHTHTSCNLQSELRLLDAIDMYEQGAFDIINEHQHQFSELVSQIINGHDRNEIDEEEIGRVFDTDRFEVQMQIKQLAYYVVGKQLTAENHDINIDQLDEWSDTMDHGFYIGLSLSDDNIEHIIDDVRLSSVLRESRACSYDENIAQFCRTELKDELSDDEVIAKIDHMNDGAYTYLPDYLQTIAYHLLRTNKKDLWYRLLVKLKYFPLQGVLIYDLHTVEDCVEFISIVGKDKSVRKKVLLYLLRERLFDIMRDECDNLRTNAGDTQLPDKYRTWAVEELHQWQVVVDRSTRQALETFIATFGIQDMAVWMAHKDAQAEGKSKKYFEGEMEILKRYEANVMNKLDITTLDMSNLDLCTLLYVSQSVCKSSSIDNVADDYLKVLCHLLYTDKGFTLPQLTEKSIGRMRDIYQIMQHSKIDLINYPQTYKPSKFEDTSKYYQQCFRCQAGDAYWYSILMLQREADQSTDMFWTIASMLIGFNKEEHQVPYDCFFLPLYLTEVVAIQILPQVKDNFEEQLIETSARMSVVLRVLTANGGCLSDSNKRKLQSRLDERWKEEASLLKRQDARLYGYLMDYTNKVKLT